jgi:hypothetical protein
MDILDSKTATVLGEYELTDSKFGIVSGIEVESSFGVEFGVTIIKEYSKRNMNVAANLMKAFIWQHEQYDWPLHEIIDCNKKYNPHFLPYEKDLQKYLVLL